MSTKFIKCVPINQSINQSILNFDQYILSNKPINQYKLTINNQSINTNQLIQTNNKQILILIPNSIYNDIEIFPKSIPFLNINYTFGFQHRYLNVYLYVYIIYSSEKVDPECTSVFVCFVMPVKWKLLECTSFFVWYDELVIICRRGRKDINNLSFSCLWYPC